MTEPMSFAPPEGDAPTPAPIPVTPVVKPKAKGGRLTNGVLAIAALVAVAGLAFAGGRATAPASAATGFQPPNGFPAGGPTGSFDPSTLGGGFGADRTVTLTGTVKSLDGSTLVITAADGTETTIDVSGTSYHAQAAATAADVTAGDSVQVAVSGLGGFRPGAAPGASAAPQASAPATGTIKATDVTITRQ